MICKNRVMEFDVCISVGEACRVAYQMVRNFMRTSASPLDWVSGYSLETVLHLFETEFDDFFVEIKERDCDEINRHMIDTKNHIVSPHHFKVCDSIQEGQKKFREVMLNRYRELNKKLLAAEKILIVRASDEDEIGEPERFLEGFSKLYPYKEIMMLHIRSKESPFERTEFHISDKLKLVQYTFSDVNPQRPWTGSECLWRKVFENYYLSEPMYVQELKKWNADKKEIAIYGAGKDAEVLVTYFKKYGVRIDRILVTSKEKNPDELDGITVEEGGILKNS